MGAPRKGHGNRVIGSRREGIPRGRGRGCCSIHTTQHIVAIPSSVVVVAPPSVHRLSTTTSGNFVAAVTFKNLNSRQLCYPPFYCNIFYQSSVYWNACALKYFQAKNQRIGSPVWKSFPFPNPYICKCRLVTTNNSFAAGSKRKKRKPDLHHDLQKCFQECYLCRSARKSWCSRAVPHKT